MNIKIATALTSLCPDCRFVVHNDSYDTIVWNKDNPKPLPSKKELIEEIDRLQAEYDSKEYQRKRVEEYPPIEDQLDTIFHGGLTAWRNEIQRIKNKYPKP